MGTTAARKVTPPVGGVTQQHPVFVYDEGEHPGWRESSDVSEQRTAADDLPVTRAVQMPLTLTQHTTTPATLHEVYRRVALLTRAELIYRYQNAYANDRRLIAGIMAVELIERGIPPCFWHEILALDNATINQRADLVLTDLAWLRRWYPDHVNAVRYRRGKALLTGSEAIFRQEVNFAFYQGRRPAWKLVGSMSMTERQQWDSAYLRSTPVKRYAEATDAFSAQVQQALADDVRTTRRTAAFTDADANASFTRRYALWCCSRMVKNRSPTEIAKRYEQMSGMPITRQAAAKQLEKVRATLRTKGIDFMC